MKRILFFISSMRGGGAERVMSILANSLSERAYDVHLAFDCELPVAYELSNNIKIYDFSIKGLPFVKRFSKIRRFTNMIEPDIVVSFMTGLNVYVILSLLCSKYPVVASEHTSFHTLKESGLASYIKRYYINRFADKVTLLTNRDFEFIGNRLRNMVVMPNPLSFKCVDSVGVREKIVLACGSIDRYKDKGFDSLILIWTDIVKKHPDWELHILGGGSSRNMNDLLNIVKNNNLENSVKILGFSNNVAKIMSKSSIFVMSSRFEGFSMVLVEAMSQGCACVSYDCVAGPNEIINNDIDGVLVEDQNREKLACAIEDLISNPEKRINLANNAIKNIKRFSVESISKKWEELFSDLLK